MAAFMAEAILPEGFFTTVTRGSPEASCQAISSVWSLEGPTASTSSNSPAYCWARTRATESAR
jgi:hypothetical protein